MGGIDDESLDKVHSLGFDSAVLCGAIWNSVWEEESYRKLMEQANKYV